MRRFLLTAGLAVLLAQPGFSEGLFEQLFEQIDVDRDRVLTSSEFERFFDALDTNRDESVSRDEFAKRPAARADRAATNLVERLLENFDADKDGRLTKDELP